MIGLAVLEWLAEHIETLTVGENAFYEDLPIDFNTGSLKRFGVFVTTEGAPMTKRSDRRQFLTIYVAIGEGAKIDGIPVAEKYATDVLLDEISDLTHNALEYHEELCELKVTGTDLVFRDVRILPSQSRFRGETLANGAIVKSMNVEVVYKKERTDK